MKLSKDLVGIEWGGPKDDWWYISLWNWLSPEYRFIGLERLWYDGPHATFGFWFFNISWCTPWTKAPKEFRD